MHLKVWVLSSIQVFNYSSMMLLSIKQWYHYVQWSRNTHKTATVESVFVCTSQLVCLHLRVFLCVFPARQTVIDCLHMKGVWLWISVYIGVYGPNRMCLWDACVSYSASVIVCHAVVFFFVFFCIHSIIGSHDSSSKLSNYPAKSQNQTFVKCLCTHARQALCACVVLNSFTCEVCANDCSLAGSLKNGKPKKYWLISHQKDHIYSFFIH